MEVAELAIAAVAVGGGLAFLFRHRLRAHLHQPVVFTVGHIALGGLLVGLMFGSVVYVSHLNRVELNKDREAQSRKNFNTLQSQILTRTQVADIGQRLIALATPSNAERNRRNLVALKSCVMSHECRKLLTTIVVRTLRVETPTPGATNTRTIVIDGKRGPRGLRGFPGPAAPSTGDDAQLAQEVASLRAEVQGLKGDKSIDSGALARVDNLLSNLEGGLNSVLSRLSGVDRLVGLLCRALPVCR